MKKKIFIIFSFLSLVVVITTGIFSSSFFRNMYLKSIEDKIVSNSVLAGELLIKEQHFADMDFNSIANFYAEKVGAKAVLYNEKGEIIGESFMYSLNNHENEMFNITVPIDNNIRNISSIKFYVYPEQIKKFNQKYIQYITISMLAGLVVAFLLGVRYIEYITKPYQELIKITKEISNGHYGEKVNFYGDDDFKLLADNFNSMSSKLQNTILKLQESNNKLRATITSIFDGLIAFDNNLNVILFNKSAEKMFDIKEKQVMGKNILDTLKDSDLCKLISEMTQAENVVNEREVEMFKPNYRVLNIHANHITLSNDPTRKLGIVFIFQDITKLKQLERVREDFVANVSHELKTPLTSIKGFIETLKNGAIENKEVAYKFLGIVDDEVNRLNVLIEDLLLLSKIEDKKHEVNKEFFGIDEVVDEVFDMLSRQALLKNINLIDEIEDNLPNVYGNYNYFKQMIMNLVDNGIKYTQNGGEVRILAYAEKENIIIKVKDNGMGIDKEHYSRLFERFYRVDKARSRQVGGTGLGLAIVKHIVLLFNGSISVESEIGKGSTFTIAIPTK